MKWLLFLVVFMPVFVNGQIITTVAGNGTNTFSGNGAPATAAGIPDPIGGTFDNYGNYYFADATNANRICKIDVTGIITTVAGNGMGGYNGDNIIATSAKLYLPCAVKLDTFGNLIIADCNNHRIREINAATGNITTIAGTGAGGYNFDNVPATAAELFGPSDVCFDKWGNLYIADYQNYRVRKIDPSGVITTFAGIGTSGSSGDNGPATAAQLLLPSAVVADDTGNIYIAERGGNRVRKVNLAGIITTFAGTGSPAYTGDGVPASAAPIVPGKLAFDTSWQLFITDDYNERVYMVDHAGILHLVAGNGISGYTGDGGPATAAEILYPSGVAFDPCGNLYIPVVTNHYIRKVTFNTSGSPSVTIAAIPGDTICAGTAVTYTATVMGSSTFTYQWYKNGVVVSATGSTYTYTPANEDSVRCLFTGTDLCGGNTEIVSSNTINMVVNTNTEPGVMLSGITSASIGAMVTVTATVTSAGSSYDLKWFNNSVLFNTTTTPMVTYTKAAGTDNITARVISTSAGCYDSAMSAVHTVTVTPEGAVKSLTSKDELYIYPNPVNNILHIDVSAAVGTSSEQNYKILSIVGSVMQQGTLQQGSNNIPVQSLPAGVYMVEISSSEGEKTVKKIIKQGSEF